MIQDIQTIKKYIRTLETCIDTMIMLGCNVDRPLEKLADYYYQLKRLETCHVSDSLS